MGALELGTSGRVRCCRISLLIVGSAGGSSNGLAGERQLSFAAHERAAALNNGCLRGQSWWRPSACLPAGSVLQRFSSHDSSARRSAEVSQEPASAAAADLAAEATARIRAE
eukprot:8100923-Pyramimonas_sp.AAC.1